MTIEEIFYSEDISVRSLNVCKYNDLNQLSEILDFYYKNNSFGKLRNCGQKSNDELIALCLKYKDYDSSITLETKSSENQISEKLTDFTNKQLEVVSIYIDISIKKLSKRSKNSLIIFLNGNFQIQNLCVRILDNKNFNFYDIKNVGTKSVEELKGFFDSIILFIDRVDLLKNKTEINNLRVKLYIENIFSIYTIPNEVIESQSIFKIVDFLLNNDTIFQSKEKVIFQNALKIFNNQNTLTFDEISASINITGERVRQIKNQILDILFEKLKFIKTIEDDLDFKYGIGLDQNLIYIDANLNKRINELNSTNFSVEFNSFLIYVYFSSDFDLVGEIEDVLHSNNFKSKNRYNWKGFYLVKKLFVEVFDFNKFADDVDKRINARIEKTYSFSFKSYLLDFAINNEIPQLTILKSIAEKIINQEFNLKLDINEDLIFNRNTFKHVSEYAIEALEKLGLPSKIEDIFILIENRESDVTKNQEALRGSLQRSQEIIYFGRSSTYGLKKWEIEKEGIKGGTIKDIILEFLQDKREPIHILEILSEVHKYRAKTSVKSILANLNLDPYNQFVIFTQSFIGINGRLYDSNLTNLPKFIGKSVTTYIKKQKDVNRIAVEVYFANQLKISLTNMKYIIDNLIEQQFVFVNAENILSTSI